MKKLIKPASLLLYLLAILTFTILGMSYAGLTGAAKGQGLAGGAIVLGYGVMFGFLALVVALFVAWYATHKAVVTTNKILALVWVIVMGVVAYRFYTQENPAAQPDPPKRPVTMEPVAYTPRQAAIQQEGKVSMGLGFFMPNFYEQSVLYFYGKPNLEKPVQEHTPTDSIVFQRLERGGFEITYAPPWLMPDHLKLDYDMLYFRVQTIGRDFVEVTVNTMTGQTTYVNRYAGKVAYWPDFLLGIHSVEFIVPDTQKILYKPLAHAGEVATPYQFMRPLMVKADWMEVELQDSNFKPVGKGWIRWKSDGELLIRYSLLS